jgi:hypothetical protein
MSIITPWSLVLGLLLASPALAQAWSDPGADIGSAMLRFVLGTLVAGIGLAVIGALVDLYRGDGVIEATDATDADAAEAASSTPSSSPLAA